MSRATETRATTGEGEGRKRRKTARHGPWILGVALVGALAVLYFTWTPLRDFLNTGWGLVAGEDREGFARWIDGFGAWGPAVILASMLFQTLAAFIPSLIVLVVSVLAFGPFWGGLLNVTGLLLGSAMAYWIGRGLGLPVVQGMVGESTEERIEEWVGRYGFWTVVAFRISPILSSDGVSYVGGVLSMGFSRFMTATALGVLPLCVLVSWFGEDIDRLESGMIWVGVGTALLLVGWVAYDRWIADRA